MAHMDGTWMNQIGGRFGFPRSSSGRSWRWASGRCGGFSEPRGDSSARRILEEPFARGEIDAEELRSRLAALEGHPYRGDARGLGGRKRAVLPLGGGSHRGISSAIAPKPHWKNDLETCDAPFHQKTRLATTLQSSQRSMLERKRHPAHSRRTGSSRIRPANDRET
jgi:hypothetical protein